MTRVGFIINGAAALIAQELALLRVLLEGRNPGAGGKGVEQPQAISGVSSGSLSSVCINAILAGLNGQSRGNRPFTWDILLNEILFPLKDDDIYKTGPLADLQRLENIAEGFIYDTDPLKATLTRIVNGEEFMNWHVLGDLYVQTHIPAISRMSGAVHYASSIKNANINLVDMLMGSTAIPVAFPPRNIPGFNTSDDDLYIDGGMGSEGVPVNGFIQDIQANGLFDEVYVIGPQRSDIGERGEKGDPALMDKHSVHETDDDDDDDASSSNNHPGIIANATFAFEVINAGTFPLALYRVLDLVKDKSKAFVYIPELKHQYGLLNFGVMKKQYDDTIAWASGNDPIPVQEYLNRYFPEHAKMLR